MDRMGFFGTEPLSGTLLQMKYDINMKCLPNIFAIVWSQIEWCNEPTKLQFKLIYKGVKFDSLKHYTNQPNSTYKTWLQYMCPQGPMVHKQ